MQFFQSGLNSTYVCHDGCDKVGLPEKVPFRTVVFSSKPSDQGTGTLPDSCLGCERFEVGTALSTLRVAQSDGMKLREHPFLYQEKRSWRLAGSC